VHGSDGLDEITTTGETWGFRVHKREVEEILINPRLLGFELARPEDLRGGNAAANARTVVEILNGAPGPKADIVLLNAGAAIHVAGLANTIAAGVEMARKSVAEGKAMGTLEALRKVTAESGVLEPQ
jgi:anthranilate phosphoribosyltransferase